MPPQFENAIVTPVARAVAVEPDTVAVRCAKKGMTAALVHAIMKTATYRPIQFVKSARSR